MSGTPYKTGAAPTRKGSLQASLAGFMRDRREVSSPSDSHSSSSFLEYLRGEEFIEGKQGLKLARCQISRTKLPTYHSPYQ